LSPLNVLRYVWDGISASALASTGETAYEAAGRKRSRAGDKEAERGSAAGEGSAAERGAGKGAAKAASKTSKAARKEATKAAVHFSEDGPAELKAKGAKGKEGKGNDSAAKVSDEEELLADLSSRAVEGEEDKAVRARSRKAAKRARKAAAKAELIKAVEGGDGREKNTTWVKSEMCVGMGEPVRNPKPRHLGGGLKIKDTHLGTGPVPSLGKTVKILYEGMLADGSVFDKRQVKRR